MTPSAQQVKACCAAAYGSTAARVVLGDSFHPGGAALTARLVSALDVEPGGLVVDVASGLGTSAIQVARETGCDVIGVDLSHECVAHAAAAAERQGLSARVRFLRCDAEALPLPDGSADGVLCECALCTFPDKERAAAELARVLRPGARLALSDVTAEPGRLPTELQTLEAWVACVGNAHPLEDIGGLLTSAGLAVEASERHDDALLELVERVDARLRALRLVLGEAVEQGLTLTRAARQALDDGALGYAAVIARRP